MVSAFTSVHRKKTCTCTCTCSCPFLVMSIGNSDTQVGKDICCYLHVVPMWKWLCETSRIVLCNYFVHFVSQYFHAVIPY